MWMRHVATPASASETEQTKKPSENKKKMMMRWWWRWWWLRRWSEKKLYISIRWICGIVSDARQPTFRRCTLFNSITLVWLVCCVKWFFGNFFSSSFSYASFWRLLKWLLGTRCVIITITAVEECWDERQKWNHKSITLRCIKSANNFLLFLSRPHMAARMGWCRCTDNFHPIFHASQNRLNEMIFVLCVAHYTVWLWLP